MRRRPNDAASSCGICLEADPIRDRAGARRRCEREKEFPGLEQTPLTPQAQQARDEILELLTRGQRVQAIRRYMQASGKRIPEAKSVIDRLSRILERPDLDESQKRFLDGFRASLDKPQDPVPTPRPRPTPTPPSSARAPTARGAGTVARMTPPAPSRASPASPPRTRSDPADDPLSGPPGIRAVLLHVLIAQLAASTAFALLSAVFGALGYFVNSWLAMAAAMVAGVMLFILFPALLDGLLERSGLRRWTRRPSLLFDFAVGILLLATSLLGGYSVDRWLWNQGAEVVAIAHPDALTDRKSRAGREIYRLDELRIARWPAAIYDKHTTRNADRGGSYVDHWHVSAIAAGFLRKRPCLWFGWRTHTGRAGFDDPLPPWESSDHYVIVDDDRYYRRAVQSALGLGAAPECTTIVNRVPSPSAASDRLARDLIGLLALTAGLPWLFLLVSAAHGLYRRVRTALSHRR